MNDARGGTPKGSEIPVGEWLDQIGARAIEYAGDDAGGGPPDYTIEYEGEPVAVEVRLLDDGIGWRREKKVAFEREVKELIEEEMAGKGSPRWHSWVEYDPDEDGPPKRGDKTWRKRMCEALRRRELMVEVQLLSAEDMRGRGIVLTLQRASNQGSFNRVDEDEGMMVGSVLAERIRACVKEKADKVEKGARTRGYDRWWLVLDDEVLVAPKGVMTKDEQRQIEDSVRTCTGRSQWSKIVLMSRFQTVEPPEKQPKWFWPLWEDPGHAPLPCSPA